MNIKGGLKGLAQSRGDSQRYVESKARNRLLAKKKVASKTPAATKAKPKKAALTQKSAADIPPPPKAKCTYPGCGAVVTDLAKHEAKTHSPEAIKRRQQKLQLAHELQVTKTARNQGLKKAFAMNHSVYFCERCFCSFPSTRAITAHLREFHKILSHPARNYTFIKKSGRGLLGVKGVGDGHQAPSHKGSAGDDRNEGRATEDTRSRDATFAWGGSFRDHGQFGSHPSYDSMDDESSA